MSLTRAAPENGRARFGFKIPVNKYNIKFGVDLDAKTQ